MSKILVKSHKYAFDQAETWNHVKNTGHLHAVSSKYKSYKTTIRNVLTQKIQKLRPLFKNLALEVPEAAGI